MMKKATNRLIAFLMVLVMLLDAAPLAVLAEDLGDNGQIIAEAPVSGQVEAAGEDSEKSLANDETKGKQFGVKKKVAHELTEGEYEVHDIPDSKLNELKEKYLENWKPNEANPSEASDGQAAAQALTIEPPKASFSKLRMSRTAVSSTNTDSASTAKGSAAVSAQDNEPQQAQGLVAYDIELVKDKASAAEEYQVTIPVDNVDMLDGHRNADSGKTLKILNVSYRLIHIHTDENGDSTETTIDGDNVNVNYTPDGKITDFSFTVDSFSTFVLVYTVDFVYIEKKTEISIDLDKLQKNGNELGQLLYKNSQELEEIAVADILDFAQDYLQDENVCGEVYTVSLQNGTALSDFDQNFFANSAVSIEGKGIEYGSGKITLLESFDEAKITFASEAGTLELTLENYTAPEKPVVPETEEGFSYRFFTEEASIAEILAANEIVSSYYNIVSLSDTDLVTVDGDTLTAQDYFDAVTLTVALSDGSEVEIILSNPAPVKANETVITEGVGSFAADTEVPAGTMLVVDSNPKVPEGIVLPGGMRKGGPAESDPVFFEVSLIGPDGEPVKAGADVTLNTAIELPEAPEGQIVKVTGVKVYHIGEKGDAEELEGATYALAEGKISSVSFTTPGFSLFAITYTVDFISAEVNKAWSWPGEGSYSVADIMTEIGVTGDIESVDLVRTDDQGGSDKALYLEEREDGHYLVSEEAFVDTFMLTVVVDGVTYHFTVTDEIPVTSQITANISSGTTVTYDGTEEAYKANVTLKFLVPLDQLKEDRFVSIQLGDDIRIPASELGVERAAIDYDKGMQSFTYKYILGDDGKYYIKIEYYEAYLALDPNITKNTIIFDVFIKDTITEVNNELPVEITQGLTVHIPTTDITYPEDEDAHNNIHVDKAYQGYGTVGTGENQKTYVDYTVRVSTTKGTKGAINLQDALSDLYLKVNYNDTETSLSAESSQIISISKNGSTQTAPTITFADNGFTTNLDQLSANEYYDITYRYVFNQKIPEEGESGSSFNVQAGGKNTVKATSGGQTSTDQDSFYIEKSNNPVTIGKSGVYDGTSNPPKIDWTIRVILNGNESRTLTDELFAEAIGQISVTNEDGTPASNYDYNNGSNSITFTQAGTYIIQYSTPVTQAYYTRQEISNSARVDNNDNWKSDTKVSVPPSEQDGITKSWTGRQKLSNSTETTEYYNLSWDVSFAVPADGFKAGTVFKESPYFEKSGVGSQYDRHYLTQEQQAALVQQLADKMGLQSTDFEAHLLDVYGYNYAIELKKDWSNPSGLSYINLSYQTTGVVDLNTINLGLTSEVSKDKFYNVFWVDNVSAEAYYAYSREVNKLDATQKGGGSVTYHDEVTRANNTLSWAVVVDLNDDYNTMTISDTIPAGLTLYKVGIGGEYAAEIWTPKASDESVYEYNSVESNTNRYMNNTVAGVTANKSSSGTALTVNIDVNNTGNTGRPEYFKYGSKLYVYVYVTVDQAEFHPIDTLTKRYTNTVTVTGDSENLGSADQTQVITLNTIPMTKSVSTARWETLHELEYTVDINSDAHAMTVDENGDPIPGATFSLNDVLEFRKTSPSGKEIIAMLVPGSVKLQEYQNNTWQDYNGNWSYQFTETKDGDMRYKTINVSGIPDQTHMRLVYAYRIEVDGTVSGETYDLGDLYNEATLHGNSDYSTHNITRTNWSQFSSSGSTESTDSLLISKVDAGNYALLLPGAKFILEKWNGSAWEIINAISEEPAKFTTTDTINGVSRTVYVTSSNQSDSRTYGALKIQQPYGDNYVGEKFENNVCYRVREYEAPSGYTNLSTISDEQPAGYFFFSASGSTKDDVAWPNDRIKGLADDLTKESDTFYITNSQQASLTITKRFVGDAQPTEAQKKAMVFTVYNSSNEQVASITYDDILKNQNIIKNDKIINGQTYTVKETVLDLDGVIRTTTYSVNAGEEVTGSTVTGTVEAQVQIVNGVGTVAFKNKYETPKTSIKVNKEWLGADGNAKTVESGTQVSFQLYQLAQGQSEGTLYSDEVYTIAYDGTNWNEVTIDNLPAEDDEHNPVRYYVVETSPAGGVSKQYKIGASGTAGEAAAAAVADDSQPIVIVNRDVSITVTKKFTDAFGNEKSTPPMTEIKFRVRGARLYSQNDDIFGQDLSIQYQDGQWGTWSGTLPTDNNGDQYTSYWIEETTPNSGYVVSYLVDGQPLSESNPIRNDEDQTITIVNADSIPAGEIVVKKAWAGAENSEKTPVTVELWAEMKPGYDVNNAQTKDVIVATSYYIGSSNDIPLDIQGRTEPYHIKVGGTLKVTPRWNMDYYILDNSFQLIRQGNISAHTEASIPISDNTYLIRFNTDSKISDSFSANPTGVDPQPIDTTTAYRTATLNSENNWQASFTDLPYGYTFYVKENPVSTDFAVSYTYTDSQGTRHTGEAGNMSGRLETGAVLVTNTKDTSTTSVSLTKTWADANDAFGLRPTADQYKAMVKLYVGESEITTATSGYEAMTKTVTSIGNTYTVTFGKLPKVEGGQTYTVKEDLTLLTNYTAAPANGEVTGIAEGGTGAITNTLKTGGLKVTKTVTGAEGQGNKEFQVTVKNSANKYVAVNAGVASLSDSEVTLTVSQSTPLVITGLPYDTYTVTEVESSRTITGYTIAATGNTTSGTATIDAQTVDEPDHVELVALTNVYEIEKTSVPVTKAWTATPSGTWSVTVQLKYCEKKIQNADGTNVESPAFGDWANATAALVGSGVDVTKTITNETEQSKATFENLPKYRYDAENGLYEIEYTVEETAVQIGDDANALSNYTAAVTGDVATGFTITNTQTKTSVTVSKVWSGGDGESATLRLVRFKKGSSTPVNTNGTLNITHAVSGLNNLPSGFTATYSYSGPANASDVVAGSYPVPAGEYTVTATVTNAAAPEGYTHALSANPVTVTVPAGGSVDAAFTSTYTQNAVTPTYGNLTIAHQSSGLSDTNLPSGFAATYTISGPTTINNANLNQSYRVETGNYTVSANVTNNAAPSGYDYVSTDSQTIQIGENETKTATLTSTYSAQSQGGDTITLTFCTVVEDELTGWSTNVYNLLVDGQNMNWGGYTTNTSNTPSTTISANKPVSFYLSLNGTNAVLKSITSSEVSITNSNDITPNGSGTKTFTSGSQNITITFTIGSASNGGGNGQNQNTPVDVTVYWGNYNCEKTLNEFSSVAIGSTVRVTAYTKSSLNGIRWWEDNGSYNYNHQANTVTYSTSAPDSNGYYTYTADIIVNKKIAIGVNINGNADQNETVTATVIEPQSSSTRLTFLRLASAVGSDVPLGSAPAQSGLPANYSLPESITAPDGYILDTDFSRTITLRTGHWSETVSGLDINDGTDAYYYAIVEDSVPTGYTVAYSSQPLAATVNSIELTATNTREVTNDAQLTVSKTVSGNAGETGKDFNFTVTLTNQTSLTGTYGGMTFTNGVANFTLKHNESKTATGLPAGVQYTVTETERDANGYATVVTATGTATSTVNDATDTASGTIAEGQAANVAFTNTRNTYGNIELRKTVDRQTTDTTAFTFTVTILNANGTTNTNYNTAPFTSGVATLTLHANDASATQITGLPNGTRYKIEETSIPTNYALNTVTVTAGTATVNNGIVTGTITGGTDSVVAITVDNTHTVGSLVVSKTVKYDNSNPAKEFSFNVTILNANDDDTNTAFGGTYGDMTFTAGVSIFTLTHGHSATATGLPDGTRYTVTEQAESDYVTTNTVTSTIDGETTHGTISTGETETAAFTNSKVTGIYAKKVWTQGNAAQAGGFWPAGKTVTFQLQQNDGTAESPTWVLAKDASGADVADVTVSSTDAVSFTNLPADKTYRVVETYDGETTLTGESIKVAGGEGNDGTSEHPYVVTNDIPLTSVTVTKAWNDGASTDWPANIASVTVGLYQSVNSAEPSAVTDNGTPKQLTLTSDNASAEAVAQRTFSDLPVYDVTTGAQITYSVKEESVTLTGENPQTINITGTSFRIGTDANADVWQVSGGTVNDNGEATITNTKSNHSITVYKRWYNAYGAYESTVNIPVSVTLHKVTNTEDTVVTTAQVTPGTPAVFNVDDDTAQYYVEEDTTTWASYDFATRYITTEESSSVGTNVNDRYLGNATASAVTVQAGGALYIMNTPPLSTAQTDAHKKWVVFNDPYGTFYLGQLDGADMNADTWYQNNMQIDVVLHYKAVDPDDSSIVYDSDIAAHAYSPKDTAHPERIRVWFANSHPAEIIYLTNKMIPGNDSGQDFQMIFAGTESGGTQSDWRWNLLENSGSGQYGTGVSGKLSAYGYITTNGTTQLVKYQYYFEEAAVYDGSDHGSYNWNNPEPVTDKWWTIEVFNAEQHLTNIENRPRNLPVKKEWVDENGNPLSAQQMATLQDVLSVQSITVNLLARKKTKQNNEKWWVYQTLTLNAANNWKGTFTGLEYYVQNRNVTYTDNTSGTVTGEIEFQVEETWDDEYLRLGLFKYSEDADKPFAGVKLRNKPLPKGSIQVQKQWTVEDPNATAVLLKLYRVANNAVTEVTPTTQNVPSDAIFTDSTGTYLKIAKNGTTWPTLTINNLLQKVNVPDSNGQDHAYDCYYFVDEVGYLTAGATAKAEIPATWATPAYTGGENHGGSFTTAAGHNPLLSVAPAASDPPTLTVSNSLKPGSLQLIKAIAEGVQADNVSFTFQVVLTPPTGVTIGTLTLSPDGAGTMTASPGENGVTTLTVQINSVSVTADEIGRTKAVTINGIPAGTTYEVTEPTENLPTGWHQVGTVAYNDETKTIAANETTDTATITNTTTGSIKLKKIMTVDGAAVGSNTTGTFTFTIAGESTDANTSGVFKTVVITLNNDGTYSATIQVGSETPVELTKEGDYFVIPDLPLGAYTITESGADRAGYNLVTTFAVGGTNTATNSAAVTLNGTTLTATVDATNAYTAGVELPATGGPGILPYTLTGLTLLLGASLILYYRRRRREQNT